MPTGLAYYVALPKENLSRPAVSAFRDWLLLEAKRLVVESKTKRCRLDPVDAAAQPRRSRP